MEQAGKLGPPLWGPERVRRIIPVAVAVILGNDAETVLLQRRDYRTGVEGLDGMWELPGGKIEFGERPDRTIHREIFEELDCTIHIEKLIPHIQNNVWHYPDFDGSMLLIGYHCRIIERGPKYVVGYNNSRWFEISNINYTTTLPGTREFIEATFR